MPNPVSWFEIATVDLERAKAFYTAVFECEFQLVEMPGTKMYMFPFDNDSSGSSGALVAAKENTPAAVGNMIYFNCEDVAVESGRVEAAGGKLTVPKMSIGEFGFIAECMDTEGNRIGFHSHK